MLEEIKRLIKARDICVLATVSDGGTPHCSLMNYITDEDCKEIYMATQKTTKKYKNLTENNSVSLLVDTREDHTGTRRTDLKAITITGMFQEIKDDEKKASVKLKFLERHPYMNEIIDKKDSEIFCINVTAFLFLDGLTDAHFESV